jgi:hypothetical protein
MKLKYDKKIRYQYSTGKQRNTRALPLLSDVALITNVDVENDLNSMGQ